MEIIVALLVLYLGYCLGVFFLFKVLPAMLYLGGLFAGLCLREAGKLLLQAGWWLIATGLPLAFAAGRNAALFISIFVDEWRHADDEHHPQHEDDDDDEGVVVDDDDSDRLADALHLLGLQPGFNRDELNRAYKRAIRAAHPDAGGSDEAAAAVNGARDLILQETSGALS